MNKKLNTAIFFLVATAVNIALVMVLALALFIPYVVWVAPRVPAPANLLALVLIVVGSMAGSFPIYRALVAWFQTKVDVDKHFDPIIKARSRRGRMD